MNINGTLINYYFHCKRQCWLFGNRINLEDNSELVHIGKALHEEKLDDNKNTEISIGSIKIDKITSEYVTEIKKSDSDEIAAKWQLLFYLKTLKEKGINKKGKLEFIEKSKQDKKIIIVTLGEEELNYLERVKKEIILIIEGEIPAVNYSSKCKKCAYYEFCLL